jgi:hypothetical protein
MEKKITKKEILAAIKTAVADMTEVGGVPTATVIEFIDTTIDQIDAKAAKAKERAAGKKAEGDALREEVFSHVTNEWQTADAITALVVGEDITKAKVVARLTQLVKADMVEKEQQKVGDAKLMCYRVASAE